MEKGHKGQSHFFLVCTMTGRLHSTRNKLQGKSDLIFGAPRVVFPLQLISCSSWDVACLSQCTLENELVTHTPSPPNALYSKSLQKNRLQCCPTTLPQLLLTSTRHARHTCSIPKTPTYRPFYNLCISFVFGINGFLSLGTCCAL